MKCASFIIFILAFIHLTARYDYWFGYYKMPDSFFVSRLAFFLVELIILITFGIFWAISMFQRKDRFWTTSILVLFLALSGLQYQSSHSNNLIIFGLKDRILRDYKLDTLRQFARDIDQIPAPNNLLNGAGKVFMHDDLNLIKTQSKGKYAFLKGCNTPSSITEINGLVNVWWGRQQWGFSIGIDGRIEGSTLVGSNIKIILPVSKDIVFSAVNGD